MTVIAPLSMSWSKMFVLLNSLLVYGLGGELFIFGILSQRLHLFCDGPQKGAQFPGDGGDCDLSGFTLGRQPSVACT